jgi:glycosyltransferase involved in cell wall biosynthesis
MPGKLRILFVNNSTYDLPLPESLAKGWKAISDRVDVRIVGRRGSVGGADERFRLVRAGALGLAGRAFYARAAPAVWSEIRRFRPDVVSAQGPHEAFACLAALALSRTHVKLLVQVHGDWRATPRLYGSRLRPLSAPLADRSALIALRRADAIRTVGPFTSRLVSEATGRQPLACYPTYFDLGGLRAKPLQPLPATPTVVWIGMLERVKNLDRFLDAWRLVMARTDDAQLVMVGRGRMWRLAEELARAFPHRVALYPHVPHEEIANVLDASTLLALPSRSDGTPRVVMEAFARGRAVVGSRVAGIPDLVRPGHNGLLVQHDDPGDIAEGLLRPLVDRQLAERLGRGAHETSLEYDWSPERLADALVDLVTRMVDGDDSPAERLT